MTPPAPDLLRQVERLDARVRQAEATLAQVVDVVDIYGPPPAPPKRWALPELTTGQRIDLSIVLALFLLVSVRAVYALDRAKG